MPMNAHDDLPSRLASEGALDALLARPYPALVQLMRTLPGDLAILGINGKMGVSLGRLAANAVKEAGVTKRIYGISRFADTAACDALAAAGIEPLPCDLLDRDAVASLPQAPNVIFMAGRKFGTMDEADLTWAINTVVPATVCTHFHASRIVAFSTGCVYPLVPPASGGCVESTPPSPVGEYAQSCLGRERMFSYFSGSQGTRVCLIRLNYALDTRYGVLHDIAQAIWRGQPVDRSANHFNAIWQGDANNQALLALDQCTSPAAILNLTGPETLSVTQVANQLGALLDKPVTFAGEPGPMAYLNDAGLAHRLFGYPRVPISRIIHWTADWIRSGGRSLDKPTHFEVVNGAF